MKKRILPFLMFMLISSMGFAATHTLLVTVGDSIEVVYVAGEFNNWDPTADSMNLISNSPKVFSFEYQFEGLVDTLEFKFLAGPDWKYEQKQAANLVVGNDSADVVGDFKTVYHRDQEKDVLIDVLVPVDVFRLFLAGNFNNWKSRPNEMVQVDSTESGKEFQLTIHTIDTTTLEFKFIAGPGWPYEQKDAANYKYMDNNGIAICEEFKKIFNPAEAGTITINITVPEGTPDVWLIGSWGDGWSLEDAVHATMNEDGTWTATIEDVADIEYKVWNYPDWPYEEAQDATGTSVANRIASWLTGPTFDITVTNWKLIHEGVPTGIKDPISASYKMYTVNGTIVVEGVTSAVSVFDINGRTMQSVRAKGTFTSKSLQPGIYIIRVDNKVQKVAVQ